MSDCWTVDVRGCSVTMYTPPPPPPPMLNANMMSLIAAVVNHVEEGSQWRGRGLHMFYWDLESIRRDLWWPDSGGDLGKEMCVCVCVGGCVVSVCGACVCVYVWCVCVCLCVYLYVYVHVFVCIYACL